MVRCWRREPGQGLSAGGHEACIFHVTNCVTSDTQPCRCQGACLEIKIIIFYFLVIFSLY